MTVITISRGSYSHGKEIAETVAQRLGYDCISREILIEASKEFNLHKVDKARKKWSQQLYGIETADPSLYDMVINIGQLAQEDAVEIICHKASLKRFKSTPESQQKIEDLSLSAKAKAAIIEKFPSSQVNCQNAVVLVKIETALSLEDKVNAEIKKVLKDIDEIKEVRVGVIPFET